MTQSGELLKAGTARAVETIRAACELGGLGELTSRAVFDALFSLSHEARAREEARLRDVARMHGCKTEFERLLKARKREYVSRARSGVSNVVMLKNMPPELDGATVECGAFTCTGEGVASVDYNGEGERVETVICTHPLLPVEYLESTDDGTRRVRLAFYKEKRWRYETVERRMLADRRSIVELSGRGVDVTSERAGPLVQYLAEIEWTGKHISRTRSSGINQRHGLSQFKLIGQAMIRDLRGIAIVVVYHELVFVHVCRIYKHVYQLLAVFLIVRVTIAEHRQPRLYLLKCKMYAQRVSGARDLCFQLGAPCLKLFYPLRVSQPRRFGQGRVYRHIYTFAYLPLKLVPLRFHGLYSRAILFAEIFGVYCARDSFFMLWRKHVLLCPAHNVFFYCLLAFQRLAACMLLFPAFASIVIIHPPLLASSAFAVHMLAAQAAEQFPLQLIVERRGGRGGAVQLAQREPFLHALKQRPIHYFRTPARYLLTAVEVFAYVLAIVQHRVKRGKRRNRASAYPNTLPAQPREYLLLVHAVRVIGEYAPYYSRFVLAHHKPPILNAIAIRYASTQKYAFGGTFAHSAPHLLPKLVRVVFRERVQHGFQHLACGIVGYRLGGRYYPHAVRVQRVLIHGAVVHIPGKPVELPDYHALKLPFARIGQHAPEFWPVIRLSSERPVDVFTDHCQPFALRVCVAVVKLALYRLLALSM